MRASRRDLQAQPGACVLFTLLALCGCGDGSGADAGIAASDAEVPRDAGPNDAARDALVADAASSSAERQCESTGALTEEYSLPAPSAFPAGITFLSDWERLPRAGGFAGIQAMDACRMQLDPALRTWHGLAAVRVEVNPGDDPIDSGGERSEVLFMQDAREGIEESSASGRVYFGVSYYFPPSWAATFTRGNPESWSLLLQFHPGGGDGYFAGLQAGVRESAAGQELFWSSQDLDVLGDGGIELGAWVDLILDLDFGSGQTRIYRRNEGQTAFRLVLDIMDASMTSSAGSYFKQGLYRGPDVNGRTDVLWMGPTSRGASFDAVERASFATETGVP